jgi:hypothetical protein
MVVNGSPELVQSLLGLSHLSDCLTSSAFVRRIGEVCGIGSIKNSTCSEVMYAFDHAEEEWSIIFDKTLASPSGAPWLEQAKLASNL